MAASLGPSPTAAQLARHIAATQGPAGLYRGALLQALGSFLVAHEGPLACHSVANPTSGSLLLLPLSALAAPRLADVGGRAPMPARALARGFWCFQLAHWAHLALLITAARDFLHTDPLDFPATRAHVLFPLCSLGAVSLLYPLLTLRNRMLVSVGAPQEHRSALGLFKRVYRSEGVLSLWRGAALNFGTGLLGIALALGMGTVANRFAPGSTPHDLAALSRFAQFLTGENHDDQY